MGSSLLRGALALLLGLVLAFAGNVPWLAAPPPALALDQTLTSCDFASFETALAAVQADGGGTLSFACSGMLTFTHALTITSDVTLIGHGMVTFDGNASTRLFVVAATGRLALSGLTLQNGSAGQSNGGAITNGGVLEITASTFSGNSAVNGGAIDNVNTLQVAASTFNGNGASGSGGAIRNIGIVEISSSTFSGNNSTFGAIWNIGILAISASSFSGNGAFSGGAIFNFNGGTLEISASTFSGNGAVSLGGGIWNSGTATLDISATTFSGNSAGDDGGAIFNNAGSVTISANTFSNNSANGGGAIFNAGAVAVTTISASTFNGNSADSVGGAIVNGGTLDISASTFSDNSGSFGGAILNGNGTAATITASTFSDNSAADGGAIFNDTAATAGITASTFSNNSAISTGGAITNLQGAVDVIASTFSGNGAGRGGAIFAFEGTVDVIASTFSGNGAADGGAIHNDTGSATVSASILADSQNGGNCTGAITSGGSNLSDDGSCGFGIDELGDANLAALADNGGPTFTMLPQAPSDAIDTAVCADSVSPDQRGAPRPATACDIGSVEVGAIVPVQIFSFLTTTPDPVNEGDSADLQALAYGPDNANLSASLDCDGNGSYETNLPGATSQISGVCIFPDDGSITIGLQVCDGADPANCATASLSAPLLVENLPPLIAGITTGPVAQGQPVSITVTASDPGLNDLLSYSFDCDNDGNYELGPQAANTASCALDPAAAATTLGVLVEDDDGGGASGSVTVSQTATLCGNRYTGAFTVPAAGGCPGGTVPLILPLAGPLTICINPYTAALVWSPRGTCVPGQRVHIVPDDGPLAYCLNPFTRTLRYTANGLCAPHERAGVIPG